MYGQIFALVISTSCIVFSTTSSFSQTIVDTYTDPKKWCIEISPSIGQDVEAELTLILKSTLLSQGYQAYDGPALQYQLLSSQPRMPSPCAPNMWISVKLFSPIQAQDRVFGAVAVSLEGTQVTKTIRTDGWGRPPFMFGINASTAEIADLALSIATEVRVLLSGTLYRAVKQSR